MSNGIDKVQLKMLLTAAGISSQNQKQAISIFDEIDNDESIELNNSHRDGKLSGLEMHEFLSRAAVFLENKIENLRKALIQTGSYVEPLTNIEEYGYDKNDNVKRYMCYNAEGQNDDIVSYQYDENNRLVRMEIDRKNDDPDLGYNRESEYYGKPDHIETYEYDQRGNTVLTNKYGSDDKKPPYLVISNEYDENDNLRAQYQYHDYNRNGKPENIDFWKLNEKGDIIDHGHNEVQDD